MRTQRVVSHLQGAAALRRWMLAHLPQSDSMVGHDLFLKIGSDLLAGVPIDMSSLFIGLPYSAKQVRQCLMQMEGAGLIARQLGQAKGEPLRLIPTTRFVDALKAFDREFERAFALRQTLRDRHLHIGTEDPGLRRVVESVYDHFYDLGWMLLEGYGSLCCMMALLVQQAVAGYGHHAELRTGYVEMLTPNGSRFMLGAPGHAQPGQVEGHGFCVVDGRLIVDFGLGGIRKTLRAPFHWALACELNPRAGSLGQLTLPAGETVSWKNDWAAPDAEAEFEKCRPTARQLFQRYQAQFA
ncbi:MAG: hypothetical protein HY021_09070 [Burkholderiales bacterium]|nr:hypothetical protein [Burkholderiales bacterium]